MHLQNKHVNTRPVLLWYTGSNADQTQSLMIFCKNSEFELLYAMYREVPNLVLLGPTLAGT